MFVFVGESAPNSGLNSAAISQVNSFRNPPHHHPSVPSPAPKEEIMGDTSEKSDDDNFEALDRVGPLNSKSMKRNSMTNGVIQELETSLLADPDPIFQRYRKPATHQIVPDIVDIDINNNTSHTMPPFVGYSSSMSNDFGNLLDIYKSPEALKNDENPRRRNDYSLDHVVNSSSGGGPLTFMDRSSLMAASIQTRVGSSNNEMLTQTLPHNNDDTHNDDNTSNQKWRQKPTTLSVSTSSRSTGNDRTQRLSNDSGPTQSTYSSNGQLHRLSTDSGTISTKVPNDDLNASSHSGHSVHSARSTTIRTPSSTSCFPFLGGFYFSLRKSSSDSNLVGSGIDQRVNTDPSLTDLQSPVKSLSQSSKRPGQHLSQSAKSPVNSLSQSSKEPVMSYSQSAKGPVKTPMVPPIDVRSLK